MHGGLFGNHVTSLLPYPSKKCPGNQAYLRVVRSFPYRRYDFVARALVAMSFRGQIGPRRRPHRLPVAAYRVLFNYGGSPTHPRKKGVSARGRGKNGVSPTPSRARYASPSCAIPRYACIARKTSRAPACQSKRRRPMAGEFEWPSGRRVSTAALFTGSPP